MSVSLYYTARRGQPITESEKSACREIVERYNAGYPFGEAYEYFDLYDWESLGDSEWERDVILDGSTSLPLESEGEENWEERFAQILDYWLECLREITASLPGAEWHVHVDDADLDWSEEAAE